MTISDSDWAKMTPREQDAKVAEVVMGGKASKHTRHPMNKTYWWEKLPTCPTLRRLPDYTSTWSGAGMVIERMRELGWWANTTLGLKTNTVTWSKSLAGSVLRGIATLPCPKQAIALAAIRAREGEG